MTRGRWFRFFLALCGLAASALATPAYAQERSTTAADRQILVMLKMAPPHYRPGAAYGGSYGDSAAMAARRRLAGRLPRRIHRQRNGRVGGDELDAGIIGELLDEAARQAYGHPAGAVRAASSGARMMRGWARMLAVTKS